MKQANDNKMAKPKIGDYARVRGTHIRGKVTHIRYDTSHEDPTKYKIEGRYWNEGGVIKIKKPKQRRK